MIKFQRIGLACAAAILATSAIAKPSATPPSPVATIAADIEVASEEFTLPNGLRVIVHTDRKAPVVAVNIWYHVGSRNEPAGRSGFAHLFEHLMFQGSENFKGEFFEPFGVVGVSDQNGTTHFDRTNYFQTVPTTALDMALWMESDRMGHFIGAIDQATLDEQRGVVMNEKRQQAAVPYSVIVDPMYATLYPKGHPYHLMPIGTQEDLERATLEDVRTWFKSWYGPNNAVLVLAGDIDLATARDKVTRYFGHIPASATMQRPSAPLPHLSADVREVVEDRVARALVTRNFIAPPEHTEDAVLLEMASIPFGIGEGSQLSGRLVLREQVADGAAASYSGMELAGMFTLNAYVKQGVDPARAEALLDEELERFLETGPTWEEVRAAQMLQTSSMVKGLERVSRKAELLNACVSAVSRPDCWRDKMAIVASATPERIRDAARRWLSGASYRLTVLPGESRAERAASAQADDAQQSPMKVPPPDPRFTTLPAAVDRSLGVPQTTQFPEFTLPPRQQATLSNGIPVILIERSELPLVMMRMDFVGGRSSSGAGPALSELTFGLLTKGAGDRNTQQFAARQMEIGASTGAGATGDSASVSVQALADRLPESLDLVADMIKRPMFAPEEIERVRAASIVSLKQMALSPAILSMVTSEQLYGAGHPYNMRMTEADITAITREDMLAYHRERLRPELASITIAGDTSLAEILPLLEARFGQWAVEGNRSAVASIPVVAGPRQPRVILVDQPGAQQATIMAAKLVSPTGDENADLLDASTRILGAGLLSRLNLNLREDKHWSYGASAAAGSSIGQRIWMAQSRVQQDKTAESIVEIKKEIAALANGSVPITADEMERVRSAVFAFPSAFESLSTFIGVIANGRLYGKPDDYLERYMDLLGSVEPDQLRDVFAKEIDPESLTWIVMGELSTIEAPVRALGLGETIVIDPAVPLSAASQD
ncbi:M16 family metallopeptidase [Luteimonas sp. RIT-PG2_3]